ncbi:MAG: hypothetical protein ACRDYF_01020 [Acidimicrobiia bacterium]
MLHTIDRTVTVPAGLDEVVRWCASAEARLCFPGAGNVSGDGTGLFFEVKIRAPGAVPATVSVYEYLKSSWRLSHGYEFETSQVWTWPNRDTGISWHRYRLTERPGKTTLDFRWRYILPGLAGAQVLSDARFSRSIEKAAEIYVDRLARRIQPLAA